MGKISYAGKYGTEKTPYLNTFHVVCACFELTLNVPCISESCVKVKPKLNFYFHISLWYLKIYYEGLHKTFRDTTKKCEIKIYLNFFSSFGIGRGKVNESRYIALLVVSGSIKKLFSIDYVNISLLSVYFSIDFAGWKVVELNVCFNQKIYLLTKKAFEFFSEEML